MRGCFVTGTDTGAGKTVVTAAIVAALRARGTAVRVLKPIITGLDEEARPDWPHDHELLARAAEMAPEEVAILTFGPAVSPHLAAELAGRPIDPTVLRAAIQQRSEGTDVVVVEGVGGLLVPLTDSYSVRDLARDIGLPLVLAARPGLGTISHTMLTLEAARAEGLTVAGVVLTPWPEAPSAVELSNRRTIERLGGVPVATLPYIGKATVELLTGVGALLPVDAWVG